MIENKISRRDFLINTALLGGAVASGAKIFSTEVERGFFLDNNDAQLLSQAKREGVVPEFGALLDFGNETGEFPRLDKTKERIDFLALQLNAPIRHLGIFARMDQFENPQWTEQFLSQLKYIHEELRAVPIIALQTGFPPGFPENYLHPFATENEVWLQTFMENTVAALKSLKFEMGIRLFYEMNAKKSFVYCVDGWDTDLSHEAQIQGFKNAFVAFDQILKTENIRDQFSLIYSPMAGRGLGIVDHYPGKKYVDEVALDAYDYALLHSIDILGRKLLIKETPEALLAGAIRQLQKAHESDDVVLEEIGSRTQDVPWLTHAIALALSLKVKRIMHFDFDKSMLGEWDFRMNNQTLVSYRNILDTLRV